MRTLLRDVGSARAPRTTASEALSRRAEAPARARQGARGAPRAAHPRRAHRPARPGLGRPALRARPRRRRRRAPPSSTSPTGSRRSASWPTASRSSATAASGRPRRRRDHRRRAARDDRRPPARVDLPAQARCGGGRAPRTSSLAGLTGAGFSDVSLDGAPRRDHRRRRRRRQRPERAAARPRRPRSPSTGSVTVDGTRDDRNVALHDARRLHARRPASRGPDDDDCRCARTRPSPRSSGSAPACSSAASASWSWSATSSARCRSRPRRSTRRLGALRRQPAEGRMAPRAAVAADDPAGRRAHPGRRRRRARGDLPDPARVSPTGHPGHRRVVRRQGARGTLRPGHRHVARPRGRRRSAATRSPRSG